MVKSFYQSDIGQIILWGLGQRRPDGDHRIVLFKRPRPPPSKLGEQPAKTEKAIL